MSTQLLEIQPRELKFIVELKKQSSCAVRLSNNTHYSVAFKVKTTSPKKYCVRPNVGIILAKSTCEFTVTMQAPKAAPVDLICKDKFLIQSTVVPLGTTDKDVTSNMFSKDGGKYVEEIKLTVDLISPPESPIRSPINVVPKQGPLFEGPLMTDPVLSGVENTITQHKEPKTEEDLELKPKKNVQWSKPEKDPELMQNEVDNSEEVNLSKEEELKPENNAIYNKPGKDGEFPQPKNALDADHCPSDALKDAEFSPPKAQEDAEFPQPKNAPDADFCPPEVLKDAEFSPPKAQKDVEFSPPKAQKDAEFSPSKGLEEVEFSASKVRKESEVVTVKSVEDLKSADDIDEMKSKLSILESKLNEAESAILKLTEERRLSIKDRKILQEELAKLRSSTISRKRAQEGFPLLFVVMVALISIFLGYFSHF